MNTSWQAVQLLPVPVYDATVAMLVEDQKAWKATPPGMPQG